MVITDADFDGDNIIYTVENSNLTANQSFEDVSLFVDGSILCFLADLLYMPC